MLTAGVGIATGEDPYIIGEEACRAAVLKLGEAPISLVIVFASVEYDQEKVLQGVRSVSKDTLLVGSSTAGEITTDGAARAHSVAVMAISSDSVVFTADVAENIAKGATEAGKSVADKIKANAPSPMKLFIMLPDVLVGNGADIVRGVLSSLGDHFPVVGGASGDDFKFEKTYQYLNDKVYSGAIVGLGLSGDFTFGIGVKHGWVPIGLPKKATKSNGSTLYELDGKPAIQIYEEYFGAENIEELRTQTLAKLGVNYPLGIKIPGSDEMLIRDPLTVDEHGSITCAAEVPEGSDVRLMIGSREDAIKVAEVAANDAVAALGGEKAHAVLIFNCIARSRLFGDRASDEIVAMQNAFGRQTPLIGFYTYGEQAPLDGEVRNIEKCNPAFHNETVVVCVLS